MRNAATAALLSSLLVVSASARAQEQKYDGLHFSTAPGLAIGGMVEDLQADTAGFGVVWDLALGLHVHPKVAIHGSFVAYRLYAFHPEQTDPPMTAAVGGERSGESVDVIPTYAGGVGATVSVHPRVNLSLDLLAGVVSADNADSQRGAGFRFRVYSPVWKFGDGWSTGPGGGTSLLFTESDFGRFFNSLDGCWSIAYQ